MRPKRVVLLVHADELKLSVLNFLLATRRYAVITAKSAGHALEIYLTRLPDAVVIDTNVPKAFELAEGIKNMGGETSVILISSTMGPGECAHRADRFLPMRFTNTELLEAVRIGTTRKRGPQKRVKSTGVDVTEAVA